MQNGKIFRIVINFFLFSTLLVFMFIISIMQANATEQTPDWSIVQTSSNEDRVANGKYQTFYPKGNELHNIQLYLKNTNGYTYHINLCEDTDDDDVNASGSDYSDYTCDVGDTLFATWTVSSASTTYGWYNFARPSGHYNVSSTTRFIIQVINRTNANAVEWRNTNDDSNPYTGGHGHSALNDYMFKAYGDDMYLDTATGSVTIWELPDSFGEITVESEYDLQYDKLTNCDVGYSCRFWFGWNSGSVNHYLYFVEYTTGEITDDLVKDQTTLYDLSIKSDYFNIPDQTTATTVRYCLYKVPKGTGSSTMACDAYVKWNVLPTNFINSLTEDFYDCDDVCSEVASSSPWYSWTGFTNGLICGGKKVICEAFVPSASTTRNMIKVMTDFKDEFPLNVGWYTWDTYQTHQQSQNPTQLIPALEWTGTTTNVMGYVIDETKIKATTGWSTWQEIYGYMEWIIHAGFFLYVIQSLFFGKSNDSYTITSERKDPRKEVVGFE